MIGIIHSVLAGVLCTTGLFLLAYESFKQGKGMSLGFSLFYGLGMLGWAITGILTDSSILVTISIIQFSATFLIFLLTINRFKNGIC